jgi:hypothetical protein
VIIGSVEHTSSPTSKLDASDQRRRDCLNAGAAAILPTNAWTGGPSTRGTDGTTPILTSRKWAFAPCKDYFGSSIRRTGTRWTSTRMLFWIASHIFSGSRSFNKLGVRLMFSMNFLFMLSRNLFKQTSRRGLLLKQSLHVFPDNSFH